MTMIAGYVANGTPVLVSDLSLFAQSPGTTHRRPASGLSTRVEGTSWQAFGLVQKVIRFGPRFAIAFAGSVQAIRLFTGEVRKILREHSPDEPVGDPFAELLNPALGAIGARETDLQFVGFINGVLFHHRCKKATASGYSDLTVGGSGGHLAEEMLAGYELKFAPKQTKTQIAVSKTLMLMGQFWSLDTFAESINYGPSMTFGGGYQAYLEVDGNWSRLGDFLLTAARSVELKTLEIPALLAKLDYVDDLLFLRVAEVQVQDGSDRPQFCWRNYAVPNIDDPRPTRARVDRLAKTLPDMNGGGHATGLALMIDGKLVTTAVTSEDIGRNAGLRWEEGDDGVVVRFTEGHLKSLVEIIRDEQERRVPHVAR